MRSSAPIPTAVPVPGHIRAACLLSGVLLLIGLVVGVLSLKSLLLGSTSIPLVYSPPCSTYLSFRATRVALVTRIFPDPALRNRPGPVVERHWLGFGYTSTYYYSAPVLPDGSYTYGSWREWYAPFWAILLLFLSSGYYSLLRTFRWMRRGHWRRTGRCLACGYNLTGNTSGVCPECGERI
jgi:hypothetical protein